MRFDFTQINTTKGPRYAEGQTIDSFTILGVREFGTNGLTKRQWWYDAICECGTAEVVSQAKLVHKRHSRCRECAIDAVSRPQKGKTNDKPPVDLRG